MPYNRTLDLHSAIHCRSVAGEKVVLSVASPDRAKAEGLGAKASPRSALASANYYCPATAGFAADSAWPGASANSARAEAAPDSSGTEAPANPTGANCQP